MPKPIEYYIEKYGEESGKKRYHGVIKSEKTKKEKYLNQPYKRLTREWYNWRYGEEEGTRRYNEFSRKCAHKLDIFIEKYGEEEGTRRYNETISKKNTVKQTIEKYGEEEGTRRIKERYLKQQETFQNKPDEEKRKIYERRINFLKKTIEKNKGKSKLDIFIEKYGEEEGTRRYNDYKAKIFSGPSRMSSSARRILEELQISLEEEQFNRLFFSDKTKNEYFLIDKCSGGFYSYDFTDVLSKTILEFHGSFWHPRILSARYHPVTKIPLIRMWDKDRVKKKIAEENDFLYLEIFDTDGVNNKKEVLNTFIQRVKEFK